MLFTLRNTGLASDVLPQLKTSWETRLAMLTQTQMDPYGDLLYAHLLATLTPLKDQTMNALLAAIHAARSPKDLEVPLWEYTSGYSTQKESPLLESRIGTGPRGLPPVPLYAITHKTDVLCRLAAAYGADFYVYDRYKDTLSAGPGGVLTRREIVLAYYPHGLPQALSDRVLAAYTRQLERTPYTPTWVETLVYTDPMQTPHRSPRPDPMDA